jgi:hypothetical protein
MKSTAIVLTFTALLLSAGTPVLAESALEPPPPSSDLTPPVTPYDPNAPAIVVVPAPEPGKNTGASNPDTPDPTKNTPGAEAKN